jgi:acetyl-CoA carboxylase beta subunit
MWKRLSEDTQKMAPTAIMRCPNCTGLVLAGAQQKTKICPYCGKNINLQKAIRVARAANALEASEMLKQLKTAEAQNPSPKPKRA